MPCIAVCITEIMQNAIDICPLHIPGCPRSQAKRAASLPVGLAGGPAILAAIRETRRSQVCLGLIKVLCLQADFQSAFF